MHIYGGVFLCVFFIFLLFFLLSFFVLIWIPYLHAIPKQNKTQNGVKFKHKKTKNICKKIYLLQIENIFKKKKIQTKTPIKFKKISFFLSMIPTTPCNPNIIKYNKMIQPFPSLYFWNIFFFFYYLFLFFCVFLFFAFVFVSSFEFCRTSICLSIPVYSCFAA